MKWQPQDGPVCWLNTFSTLNYFLNVLSNSCHRIFCSINNNFHPVNLCDSMNWSKGATLLRSKTTKLHVFFSLCVCVCLQSTQTCMRMQVNLHVQTWEKATGWHQNAFNHSSTLFLRQSLSLNKDFNVKTQLSGKRGDRIHLSPINFSWTYRWAPQCSVFCQWKRSKLTWSCLCDMPWIHRAIYPTHFTAYS